MGLIEYAVWDIPRTKYFYDTIETNHPESVPPRTIGYKINGEIYLFGQIFSKKDLAEYPHTRRDAETLDITMHKHRRTEVFRDFQGMYHSPVPFSEQYVSEQLSEEQKSLMKPIIREQQ